MPCKSDSNHRKGATQPPVCLSTQPVLFFLRTNVYLFLYFPSLWEFFFTQSRRARVLSLTTGLVAIEFGVLTAATQPQSLAGNQSRASSPYRLRSASLSLGKVKEAILLTLGSWDLIDLSISKAWLFFFLTLTLVSLFILFSGTKFIFIKE